MPDSIASPKKNARRIFLWLTLAIAVAAVDLAAKSIAENSESLRRGTIAVAPFLNIVRAQNRGAAFGILRESGQAGRIGLILISALAAAVLIFFIKRSAHKIAEPLACSLMLGGAMGNLHDRILLGFVVDFLDFHWGGWHWPAFNAADSAITAGTILFAIAIIRGDN